MAQGSLDTLNLQVDRSMKPWCFLLWLFPAVACAETLYRCVGIGGAVSYQSDQCERGMRLDKTIGFVSVKARVNASGAFEALHPSRGERRRLGSRTHTRHSTARLREPRRVDGCAVAKSKRERALARLGLKRTYDQLSKLDVPVSAACNGF